MLNATNGGVGFAPAHDASSVITSAITAAATDVFNLMAAGMFSTRVSSAGAAVDWAYNQFGTILTHACGTGACLPESHLYHLHPVEN